MLTALTWGTLIGLIHFAIVGLLYGNPLIDRMYQAAMGREPGVREWTSRPAYLVTQFLGTQIEVYIMTIGYFWLRPLVAAPGLGGAALLGLLFTGLRVYPRFWNMYIQSTYPHRLLAVEIVNGTVSTFVVILGLEVLC